jgi:hypothetical protein
MPSGEQTYTLIRTLAGSMVACGTFRDLNAQFVAAKGSASTDDYVPVEIEVVPEWVEHREGSGGSHIVFPSGEQATETWVLNVVTVVTLSPVTVG